MTRKEELILALYIPWPSITAWRRGDIQKKQIDATGPANGLVDAGNVVCGYDEDDRSRIMQLLELWEHAGSNEG